MAHARRLVITAGALLLLGCDGPRENAGEKADANAGAVSSEDTLESGPAERLGEKQDAVVDQVEDAKEAKADALEDMAEEKREAAAQQAEALEKQAKEVRDQ